MLERLEMLEHLRQRRIHIQKFYTCPGSHDLDDFCLAGFQKIVDKHALGRIEHALFRDIFKHGAELVDPQYVLWSLLTADDQGGDSSGGNAYDPPERCDQAAPERQGCRDDAGANSDGIADRDRFRSYFSKQQE